MVQTHKTTAVRKKEIISVARKLIIRYGSEHVTVRAIAEAAGISEGAIIRLHIRKTDAAQGRANIN